MSARLVEVPMMKPTKPKSAISRFFMIIITLAEPVVSFKKTHVSIIAGRMSPSVDKHNAPNNEINNSNFGMDTANKTA